MKFKKWYDKKKKEEEGQLVAFDSRPTFVEGEEVRTEYMEVYEVLDYDPADDTYQISTMGGRKWIQKIAVVE